MRKKGDAKRAAEGLLAFLGPDFANRDDVGVPEPVLKDIGVILAKGGRRKEADVIRQATQTSR